MYPRFIYNFYKQSLYRASNSFIFQINRLSHAVNKNEEKRKAEIMSTKFPDYKVIYTFPYIKYVNAINKMKYRFTIFIGMTMPVIIGCQLVNIISLNVTVVSIITGILVTLWLHSFGILCNNLVGYIYLKPDEQKVILSYVDYWGKRMDLKTTINEVIPISDNPISMTDTVYRKIMFSSQKQKLKINMQLGQITDYENFKYILGMV